jgi:PAS domain S-box-containing protein
MTEAKILVVEDEWIIANAIQISLKRMGYTVTGIVSSGEKAITKIEKSMPHLVLMDIVLQGDIDGIELADKIKDKFNIPVIYLTAYLDDEMLERAKITEPFGYIIKPFKDRELYASIELALHNHKMNLILKERELWFSTVLSAISDGVIVTDVKGGIIFMNPVAMHLTGWHEENIKGKPVKEIFKGADDEKHYQDSIPKKVVIGEGIIAGLVIKSNLVAKDGTKRNIEKSAAQMKDSKGSITGVVIVFREVSPCEQQDSDYYIG